MAGRGSELVNTRFGFGLHDQTLRIRTLLGWGIEPYYKADITAFAVSASHAQSLGDVAREQRQKQAKDTHAERKVVTNEDIPEREEQLSTTSVSTDEHEAPAPPASNDTYAGEQWKSKIEAQRSSISSLQSQIDKVNSSIRFAGPNCVANCVKYNERQNYTNEFRRTA